MASDGRIAQGVAGPAKREGGSFGGDVATLVSGTVAAQAIGLLAAPVITRLFAPEAFGVFAVFVAITSIVGVVACLRYELAVMLPADRGEAANLLAACAVSTLAVTLAAGIVVSVWGDAIADRLGVPGLRPLLWLVPLATFASGITLGLGNWHSRHRSFGWIAGSRVAGAGSTSSLSIILGLAGHLAGGALIVASVAGKLASAGVLFLRTVFLDGRFLASVVRPSSIMKGFRRHYRFPLYGGGSALLNSASWQLPPVLLAALFSPAVAGLYALGFRMVQAPMSMIGSAVGQVFFQRASEAHAEGKLSQVVAAVFERLALLGLFPMVMLGLVGEELFTWVFGAEWSEAGVYAQILSAWAFFWFISSPMSTLFSVLEMQRFGLFLNMVNFSTRLGSLLLGAYLGDPRIALLAFSFSGVLVYGFFSMSVMGYAGVPWRETGRLLLRAVLLTLPFALVVAAHAFLLDGGLLLLGTAAVATLGYGALLFLRMPHIFQMR